ncbi:hypothetical protein CPAV1605_275 [seawater metagenome]|uniref:Uncharacterized protein n=1 Tax=seawater metagenome TaxID=1561972 RepID=A0A5E8CLW4_9ZZZZ
MPNKNVQLSQGGYSTPSTINGTLFVQKNATITLIASGSNYITSSQTLAELLPLCDGFMNPHDFNIINSYFRIEINNDLTTNTNNNISISSIGISNCPNYFSNHTENLNCNLNGNPDWIYIDRCIGSDAIDRVKSKRDQRIVIGFNSSSLYNVEVTLELTMFYIYVPNVRALTLSSIHYEGKILDDEITIFELKNTSEPASTDNTVDQNSIIKKGDKFIVKIPEINKSYVVMAIDVTKNYHKNDTIKINVSLGSYSEITIEANYNYCQEINCPWHKNYINKLYPQFTFHSDNGC